MLDPDWTVCGLLAYVGLGSGLEFLPYFAALLSLLAAALLAVVQWPMFVVVRWLKARRKHEPTADVMQSRCEAGGDEVAPVD